jgi:hypothetical protein
MATSGANLGVVRFMPLQSFTNPERGLAHDARVDLIVERALSDIAPTHPPSVGDWPRVHTAIRRDGLFVVEATAPDFKAMLRFSPERPDGGDYEIRYQPNGRIEKGRTCKVTPVLADDPDPSVSMLKAFTTRYAVATVSAARPFLKSMWLVGLNDFRIVDEADEPDHVA